VTAERPGARPALVVGSFNRAKAAEMIELLGDLGLQVRALDDFEHATPVPEDGTTFAENARLKALGLARQVAGPGILGVVADDSGLVVDALGGRPGVHSARYGGASATDPDRVDLLLEELAGVPEAERTARFRCHIALSDGDGVPVESDGVVEGRIAFAPAGDFGFGYDPIFIPEGHERTFSELGPHVKHRISHRARALRAFHAAVRRWLQSRDKET
jgi:XTP/dITP diphosphohydrolase